MNAPVLGANTEFDADTKWSAAFSWRYQKSDRHFTGSEEEPERQAENSEVINWVHQLELALTRHFGPRWSVTVGVPWLVARRSNSIRDPFLPENEFGNDPVVQRTETHGSGIGDITIVPRRWMVDPTKNPKFNISLGFGIKLPTGEYSQHDTRLIRDTTPDPPDTFQTEPVVRTIDQSIQPGDGGFGWILDAVTFYRFAKDKFAAYATATYLANPGGRNGVYTYRGDGEEIMSIPDQYLYRGGVTWFPTQSIGLGFGGRMEGIPTHDLVGSSEGFRRPGYAFSFEPTFSYSKERNTFTLAVARAEHRNRTKNVPDLQNDDHGDAAFADYVYMAGYIRRF